MDFSFLCSSPAHTCKQFHKLFVAINWIVSVSASTSSCICRLLFSGKNPVNPRWTFGRQTLHICRSFCETLSPLNEPRGRTPRTQKDAPRCVLANNLMRYDICANNFCAVLHIIENHIHAPRTKADFRGHRLPLKALCFAGQFRGQYPAVKYAVIPSRPFVPGCWCSCGLH